MTAPGGSLPATSIDDAFRPSAQKTVHLCGAVIEEPGMPMLLELFRRTNAGRVTEICDLVGSRHSPVAKAYEVLDQLLIRGLVIVAARGKRFRKIELSQRAYDAIRERFPVLD